MSSDFKILQCAECVEWCTDLPSIDRSLESPVFIWNGNEWFFRFVFEEYGGDIYSICFKLKNKRTNLERCLIPIKVGYKNEEIFSIHKTWGIFDPSIECDLLWCIDCFYVERSEALKFRFHFESPVEPLLKNSNEAETSAESDVRQETRVSSDSKSSIHLEALSRDFSKMLDESSDYDVEIRCEDETFQAHRNVLEKRSPVFSAMLKTNMIEGETGSIKVEDITASIFRSFLRYLYSGTLPELSTDTAKKHYEVGDRYAVEELKDACSDFLTKNLSEENACEILVLADQHSDQDFRKNVISYMVDKKIPECDSCWFDFCDNHLKLANEVLNLYIRKNRSK